MRVSGRRGGVFSALSLSVGLMTGVQSSVQAEPSAVWTWSNWWRVVFCGIGFMAMVYAFWFWHAVVLPWLGCWDTAECRSIEDVEPLC